MISSCYHSELCLETLHPVVDAAGSEALACASRTGGGIVRGAFTVPPAQCRPRRTIP